MIRKIIKIDEQKCTGCGLCAEACHEGAIGMIDGKARLLREDYCDGLGDCLPACPAEAISFEMRDAPAYDEAAVQEEKRRRQTAAPATGTCRTMSGGCPGSRVQHIVAKPADTAPAIGTAGCLTQWPVQIQLVPVQAPFFDGARLLIAADCTAYAFGDFHQTFIQGRVVLIGCPKLDHADYAEKLGAVLRSHRITDITVVRMEVPCCGGIEQAVMQAVRTSGQRVPLDVYTIRFDGSVLEHKRL